MKKTVKLLSFILALTMILAIPVAAQEQTPYASNYFAQHSAYFANETSSSFQVWFDVTARRGMTELGVDHITIERSSDGSNWKPVATYDKDDHSNLIAYNTGDHCSYITYTSVLPGFQYRAYVEFYAKDSSGSAYYGDYAD